MSKKLEEKFDKKGHKFRNRIMADGANGYWMQVDVCACGATLTAVKESRRAKIVTIAEFGPCPLADQAQPAPEPETLAASLYGVELDG